MSVSYFPEPVDMLGYVSKGELKIANGIKVADQMTLRRWGYPGLSIWVLNNEEQGQRG